VAYHLWWVTYVFAIIFVACGLISCENSQRKLDIEKFYELAMTIDTMNSSIADTALVEDFGFKAPDSLEVNDYLGELLTIRINALKVDSGFRVLSEKYRGDKELDSARLLPTISISKRKSTEFLIRYVIAKDVVDYYDQAKNRCDGITSTWNDCIDAGIDFSAVLSILVAGYGMFEEFDRLKAERISRWLVVFSPDDSAIQAISRTHEELEKLFLTSQSLFDLSRNPRGSLWTFRGEVRALISDAESSFKRFQLENAKVFK